MAARTTRRAVRQQGFLLRPLLQQLDGTVLPAQPATAAALQFLPSTSASAPAFSSSSSAIPAAPPLRGLGHPPPFPFAARAFTSSASHWDAKGTCATGGEGAAPPADGTPDSDEDFKPQYKKPEELPPIHQMIAQDVKENPVMVYMKGIPSAPMCGFSSGVVQILKAYGVEFKSRNVLEDDELRQGIKTFSQWPTIPQVFVNGEFVGGCDILFKMHENGELESLFASVKPTQQNAEA